MRLAAIDVGSNSVHMVVADVSREGRVQVVDRVKEMVRLGRRTFVTGKLPAESMDLAIRALDTFGRLARARNVDRLRAVATSAVREAKNGREFVRRIRAETGMTVRVISGADEAGLIFRAVRHALGLAGGPYLLVDVGGGSVELVLAQDGQARWQRSFPLGVARLSDRFLTDDPPSTAHIRQLERHIGRTLGTWLDRARRAGVERAIGTSGTVNTLIAMARAARGEEETVRMHGAQASASEITSLRRAIVTATPAQRAELPAMDAKRVDLMPSAAVLLDVILARSGAHDLRACTWALREGLLLETARVGVRWGAGTRAGRRRAVEALGQRYAGANAHGVQVARLAGTLFDALAPALGLRPEARELVEHAALLHDIGHAIDRDRHHWHTAYVIRNSELLGFDPREIEMMALVARGHRKQAPKLSDPEMRALSPEDRRTVRALAAVLRASALMAFKEATCGDRRDPGYEAVTLTRLLAEEPRFHEAHYFLGRLILSERKLVSAEREFFAAADGLPQMVAAWSMLGSTRLLIEEYDAACADFSRALGLEPDQREALLGYARALNYAGRYEAAMVPAKRLLELGAWYVSDANYWLAFSELQLGFLQDADGHVREAKRTNPMNGDTARLSGLVAYRLAQFDRAQTEFELAISRNDLDCEARLHLGMTHGQKMRFDPSVGEFLGARTCYTSMVESSVRRRAEIEASALTEVRKETALGRLAQRIADYQRSFAAASYGAAEGETQRGAFDAALRYARDAAVHPAFKAPAAELEIRIGALRKRP